MFVSMIKPESISAASNTGGYINVPDSSIHRAPEQYPESKDSDVDQQGAVLSNIIVQN
jgi:hypothetical protein